MEWEIETFRGMGPISFGMTPDDVQKIVGPAMRSRKGLRPNSFTEFRGIDIPIIRYKNNLVSEIEAFHEVPNVSFRGISIFGDRGTIVLRDLENLNRGALHSLGIILFSNLGISAGRLDEKVPEQHSITAFEQGLWDNKIGSLDTISFI